MRPDQLTDDQRKLISGKTVPRPWVHSWTGDPARSNIGAFYFDGPELEFMISVHGQIEKIAQDRRRR